MADYIYDLEDLGNVFLASFKKVDEPGAYWVFEISWRKNQLIELVQFLLWLKQEGHRLVGYNNVGFDYPVIHFIMENYRIIGLVDIHNKVKQIINTPWNQRFSNIIWDNKQHIPQLDLYKIHHFDNVAKATSLKVLEFNMRSESVEDLPFAPDTMLEWSQIDSLISYNIHDLDETEKFYNFSKPMIAFREELTAKYDKNFINANDTKIGKDYFIMELERLVLGYNKKNQTIRQSIDIADVLFPYIAFEQPEFNRILNWFKQQTITAPIVLKGFFKGITCVVGGLEFTFGAGGLHGSLSSEVIRSDDDYMIEDWDVASYYPDIAIANRLYPEHLGESFCDIYKDVYDQRQLYEKKTSENAMLKLALNGVYGDSNNEYSTFLDPQYTLSITINGQLMLCMLAEQLVKHPEVRLIQANTDGLTIRYPRFIKDWVHEVARWWEGFTKLTLESAEYKNMFINHVNAYIGEFMDGKLKRIGAYAHETAAENPATRELAWHKNH